jgi:hypothetical protein
VNARDLRLLALGGVAFTLVFAFATATLLTDPDRRYGAPLPIGSAPSWLFGGGTFDPLPFVADVVTTALLLYPAWRLGGSSAVAAACLIAGGVAVAMVVWAFTAGASHFDLVVLWLASLLVGLAFVVSVRLVRGVGSHR